MNSLLRRRTLNEILVSRKQQRKKHSSKIKPEIVEVPTEQKIETLLKKSSYNNQDKITVLRYIEKKYRIRFGVAFGLPLLTWVIEKDKAIVDKHYDSSKRSYFILKGTLSLCERGGLRETCRNQQQRYEEVQQLTEGGIGCVFNPQECHQRCVLMTQGAVLLKIDHCEGELQDLQRDCLLTTQEKQASLKLFPLFFQLGNINKFYAPFFRSQLWSKGDVIYNIGDSADYFYLIVQGEVSFESQIQVDNPELQGNQHAIAQLTLRNSYPKYLTVNTEIITACNYFGQEELIDLTPRTQTARCVSLTCILMLVPLDKFNKLMFYNDFRDHLTKAAQNRRLQRNNTIASAANLQSYRQETTKTERNDPNRSQVHFNDLNKKIYFSRTQTTEKTSKICLPDRKVRLIHGNPIRLSTHCVAKAENFSMLEVNKTQYESSMKKFRGYSLKERSKRTMNSTIRYEQKGDDNGEACARSLKQIWQVLKLQQVLHEDIERLPIDSAEGKAFYNTYMRRLKHLDHVKSYRPRTMNSSTRAKTDYLEYVQQML